MYHPYSSIRPANGSRKDSKRRVMFEDPRAFAKLFAESVTVESSSNSHWVAKNGDISLFAVLKKMVPEIAQPEDGRHRLKGKISCAEFNKLVQNDCQFMCSRTRKQCVARVAGNWLFSNRRWCDPSVPRDRDQLDSAYNHLVVRFPAFTQCSYHHFIKCVSVACEAVNQQRYDDHSPVVSSPDIAFDYEAAHRDEVFPAPASFPIPYHSDTAFSYAFPPTSHMVDLSLPAGHFAAGVHILHPQASYPAVAPADAASPFHAFPNPAACRALDHAEVSVAVISSAATSPEESSWEDEQRELNAGEDMDVRLHYHWATNPTLRVEASELERFGRSTSF